MARTTSKWVKVLIGDSSNVLRELAVDTIGNVGLTYDEVSYNAFMDAIKGVLLDKPNFSTTISGPFDNAASTGTYTVLSALNGSNTPRTLDIQFGMGATWASGMPQFGISQSAGNGVIVSEFTVSPSNNGEVKYSAKISMLAGSAAPAWGSTAES